MTSLLKTIYLSFDTGEAQRRWPGIAGASAPTAFHRWLNQPSEADPRAAGATPIISNLAAFVYSMRKHLRADFPDLYGRDRAEVAFWFVEHAAREYQLEQAYIAPLLATWAHQPDPEDPAYSQPGLLPLTHLAMHIYRRRPDLQAAFPEPFGQHRVDVVRWMIEHAASEYTLDQSYIAPLRQAFMGWAYQPDPEDPAYGQPGIPTLPNLAAYVHRSRADVRAAYPDLYGRQRIDFLLWLIGHAGAEYKLNDACIAPLRQAFMRWALCSGRAGGWRRSAYLSEYLLAHKQLTHTLGGSAIRFVGRLLSRDYLKQLDAQKR